MIWFICAALVLGTGYYVLIPLFREPKSVPGVDLPDETEFDWLLERKAVIYRNIKDLDFEHAMGRLSDADHGRLQADYKNDAALLLQKMDQLGDSAVLDESIEKEIAARASGRSMYKPRQKNIQCPSCGAETSPGKKYCADCGKRL